MTKKILIVGSSGVTGEGAIKAFLADGWEVLTMSRKEAGPTPDNLTHITADLMDLRSVVAGIAPHCDGLSHAVYAALYEKPGLIAGWRDPEQMETNRLMLANFFAAVDETGAPLEHVSLLQGKKAYGIHLHAIPLPAKESAPRDDHENFYWLQEDMLRLRAEETGLHWNIFRPPLIMGSALGVPMNLIPTLGAYAAIAKHLGEPFSFTGGPFRMGECIDTDLLGKAFSWAASTPSAHNETFNITNGDLFDWRSIWPTIAEAVGVEPGPDVQMSLREWLDDRAHLWPAIASQHGLAVAELSPIIGDSHYYADQAFNYADFKRHENDLGPAPALISTIKIRQFGFNECVDTAEMFTRLLVNLQKQEVLPTP